MNSEQVLPGGEKKPQKKRTLKGRYLLFRDKACGREISGTKGDFSIFRKRLYRKGEFFKLAKPNLERHISLGAAQDESPAGEGGFWRVQSTQ